MNLTFYSGTKNLKAVPMTKIEYCNYRNWEIPSNEDPNEDGYLVEYLDGGKPNDERHIGYISWSPKDVFEKSYNENGSLNFGQAIEAAKNGKKITRKGWNGKDMYALIMPGYPNGIQCNEATAKAHNVEIGTILKFRPYWQLKTAQNDIAMWSPSGSDTLAEDWEILD